MAALLATSDLVTASKVAAAGTRAGVAVETVLGASRLVERLRAGGARLVLLDLTMAGLAVARLVAEARQAGGDALAVVAFGPHVHEAALQAARDAGCDRVLSRGEFYARVDGLLGELGRDRSPADAN